MSITNYHVNILPQLNQLIELEISLRLIFTQLKIIVCFLKSGLVTIRSPLFYGLARRKFASVKVSQRTHYRYRLNIDQEAAVIGANMSSKHLSTGSQLPPKIKGKLRLYSMEYCPFAHRSKLVLRAKNIDHEIVNINLINKPEWLFKIHPEGKVPALDTGSEIVVDSLVICDYLNQEYPDPPLYPAEPLAREQDKALIEKISPIVDIFSKIILRKENKSSEVWKNDFLAHLKYFENELNKRGTKYFGGNNPGMVDYMLWPWAERAGTVPIVLGERLPFNPDELPLLRGWRKSMRVHPVVDGIYHGPEKFHKSVLIKLGERLPDYDAI